jgi:hypothetical protein
MSANIVSDVRDRSLFAVWEAIVMAGGPLCTPAIAEPRDGLTRRQWW